MSRDARWLRDRVIDMCMQHGTVGLVGSQYTDFQTNILNKYTPINYEKAVLYASKEEVFKSFCRKTSKKYYNDRANGKPDWDAGSPSHKTPRHKNIDWTTAAHFDYGWYHDFIQFPPEMRVSSTEFNARVDAFSSLYFEFIKWIIVDFSKTALYKLYDLSKKYAVDEIVRCMELVTDPAKRTIEYLIPIIDREQALLRYELQESAELNEHSMKVMDAIQEAVRREGTVNWDKLEEDFKLEINNKDEFDKVPLS